LIWVELIRDGLEVSTVYRRMKEMGLLLSRGRKKARRQACGKVQAFKADQMWIMDTTCG
jgi:hypothetical protein